MENKPEKLLVPFGKTLVGFSHLGVVDRWPATIQRACYHTLVASRDRRINYAIEKLRHSHELLISF